MTITLQSMLWSETQMSHTGYQMSAVHDKVHITDAVLISHGPDMLGGLIHIKAFPGTGS